MILNCYNFFISLFLFPIPLIATQVNTRVSHHTYQIPNRLTNFHRANPGNLNFEYWFLVS